MSYNRLPIRFYIPDDRLKPFYFADFISNLLNQSSYKTEDGKIQFKVFYKSYIVERFGKMFEISILSMFGEVAIYIIEIKPPF